MLIPLINLPFNSPIIFGTRRLIKVFTPIGLLLQRVSDISYLIVIVNPRIDFESGEG